MNYRKSTFIYEKKINVCIIEFDALFVKRNRREGV